MWYINSVDTYKSEENIHKSFIVQYRIVGIIKKTQERAS